MDDVEVVPGYMGLFLPRQVFCDPRVGISMPTFADFAPAMRREGWAVLPANGKSPIRDSFNKWTRAPGAAAVERWALKDADASIVYVPGLCSTGKGKRGIVVVDCDDADAIERADETFGPTPGKVRTRRGAHRLYDGAGLDLGNVSSLRSFGLNADIKHGQRGAGIAVAPPSQHEKEPGFRYAWDGCDATVLHDLPPFPIQALRRILGSGTTKTPKGAGGFREGSRGLWLNDQLVRHAWACDDFNELLDKAQQINGELPRIGHEILDAREVISRTKQVWKDLKAGKIERRVGRRAACQSDADEGRFFGSFPNGSDAYLLLMMLRAEHDARCKRGETFILATAAMARSGIFAAWGPRRYGHARDLLLHEGFIREVSHARPRQAAEYTLSILTRAPSAATSKPSGHRRQGPEAPPSQGVAPDRARQPRGGRRQFHCVHFRHPWLSKKLSNYLPNQFQPPRPNLGRQRTCPERHGTHAEKPRTPSRAPLRPWQGGRNMAAILLRRYQQDAISSAIRSWRDGHRAPLLTMPTGSGKTITFAEIARRVLPRRTLVIAHRKELIEQASAKIEAVTGIKAGVEMGPQRALASDPIVVGTVQTLAKRRPAGDPFALCIVDEAHHALADNQYAKAIEASGAGHLLGVTATSYRADRRALSAVFDDAPFSLGMLEMIDLGRETGGREGLCDVTVRTLPIHIDMGAVHVRQGDFVAGEVAAAIAPELERLADIVASEYADRKLLAFCPLRASSRAWTELLKARGLPAAHVQGDSPDRAGTLAAFARNEIRFLSNSAVLTEGYDQPDIDTILMLRPTKSRGLFAQMVGRGTRLHPGKDGLLVLDPMFTSERHNIMSAASLAAADDEQQKRVEKLMRRGLSMKAAVEADAAAEKDRLKEALRMSARRNPYLKRLAELAIELDDMGLASWEPTMGWHHEQPSAAQIFALERAGIPSDTIRSRGLASAVLDRLAQRRALGLATVKQVRYARMLGHPAPEELSFADASAWIGTSRAAA